MNKRADVTDIPLFLVIIFFLAISLIVALFVNTQIKHVIDDTVLNQSSAYSSISSSFTQVNSYSTQRGFVMMFGLFCIGMLVSSFLIRVHPIFIFLYIFSLAFTIFLSAILANTYALFVQNESIAEISANYSLMTWVMRNVVRILLSVGGLSLIILLGKSGGASNEPF